MTETNSRRRTLLIIGAGVLLVALALPKIIPSGETSSNGGNPTGGPSNNPTPVRTMVVTTETLGGTVTSVGTVLSNEQVEVRSQVSGQIERILFREGGRVKRGDLLVKINDDELRA